MRPSQGMNDDWGRYPELEEVAERGSPSALASGLLLAGLILTLAASNHVLCVLAQPRTQELLAKVDPVSALAVAGSRFPHPDEG